MFCLTGRFKPGAASASQCVQAGPLLCQSLGRKASMGWAVCSALPHLSKQSSSPCVSLQVMPLVEELANPALKARHWGEIFTLVDADIPENDVGTGFAPFSVRMLLQYSALDKLEQIQTVSQFASKEYSLEKVLEKMRNDWAGLCFRVIEYKDTGTYIIGGTDEVQALLDDHIVKTQVGTAATSYTSWLLVCARSELTHS